MNKTEARLVDYLLRWALGQEQTDPSHAFLGLAVAVRRALGEDHHPDRYEMAALYADRRPKVIIREQPAPPRPQFLIEQDRERRETERAEAYAAFNPWTRYLGSTYVGGPAAYVGRQPYVFRRVGQAVDAVRRWRQVSNTLGDSQEQTAVAVRVTADTLAAEIDAAATDAADAYTIAWVVAGLRCGRQPFCLGCVACQTVTSPHRALTGTE